MNILTTLVDSSTDLCDYVKANKPRILSIGSGIMAAGAFGTGVYATWKFKDKVDEHNELIAQLHEKLANAENQEEYEAIRMAILKQYGVIVLTAAEHYIVPLTLLGGSIACDIMSSKSYENKIAATTSLLLLTKTAYDQARQRAVEKYGKEEAAELFYGTKEEQIETIDEKGNKHIETVKRYDPYGAAKVNPFALYVGEGISSNFTGNYSEDIGLYYSVLEWYKKVLDTEGSVCLWDVYTNKQRGFGYDVGCISKDTMYLWKHAGWVRDEAKHRQYIEDCARLGVPWSAKGSRDVQGMTFGIEEPYNDPFNKNQEPVLCLLPNCIMNYEELLYSKEQMKRFLAREAV